MTTQYEDVREAAAALMEAILEELASVEVEPAFVEYVGRDGWQRRFQETLVVVRRTRWRHPLVLASYDWWDRLPQMKTLRTVLTSHKELHDRVDTLIGFDFSASRRDLIQMLIADLLTPLVEESHRYTFDRAAFDSVYERVEAGLLASTVRLLQVVPLLGFDMALHAQVVLGDGLVIRSMTDLELSAAIQTGLPDQAASSTLSRTVSRFYQHAVTKETTYPIRVGDVPGPVVVPQPIEDDALRLQTALRLVCGGSVTTGRPFQMQHPDDFGANPGYSASLSWSQSPDLERPTLLLSPAQIVSIRQIMAMLTTPVIAANRPLQMAIRRLVSAGSRGIPEDRLVDLVIAAEALFIHGPGHGATQHKKAVIASGAASLLADDPELGARGGEISRFFRGAYERRNHEVHADPRRPATIRLLDGSPAVTLHAFVEDLERVMRHAVTLTIQEHASR
ncbi:hypothetical protein F5972_24870 [Microbispora cellulosiformans]|uniref:Apea-like HEPN domain-containing protein n=1 Tax=Microbispora cellulosiformans TaxID=2614688 RepID=A0A5J5JWW3_9ACTN|nr:hypothetical protein [Microbispora cellulosiformans]KAA9375957.1 hypothetical protein F5972_24870 [Microbispora cellulosiformans]